MKTYNTDPYYDDFSEDRNFHQVMFRPGMAVQARELTQLQTILRNQIAKFGDHIFQQGSVVIPGNSFADLNTPYIKLEDAYGGVTIAASTFLGETIVGATSGVTAIVTSVSDKTSTDPITFFLSYISGGGSNGKVVFDAGEEVYLARATSTRATIKASGSPVGSGSVAYINAGVYYVSGTFVSVPAQSVILSKYSSTPSAKVLLKISETIVSASQDMTLLDPAQGSYNYAAPGADRVQITLTLTTLGVDDVVNDDYIELMRYRNGVLEEHVRYPKYNELEKSLARRTYDESGDYVVSGYGVTAREHKRVETNGGVYPDGDEAKLAYEVSPGKAYIRGFEADTLIPTYLEVPKARTTVQDTFTSAEDHGQFILIADILGSIAVDTRETIELHSTSAIDLSPPGDSVNTLLGTAKAIAIDYYTGDGSTYPIYKLYLTDITLTAGSLDQVGAVLTATNKAASIVTAKVVNEYNLTTLSSAGTFTANEVVNVGSARTATVAMWSPTSGQLFAWKHNSAKDTPIVGDQIVGATNAATAIVSKKQWIQTTGQTGLVFKLPRTSIKALKNATNNYTIDYTVHKKLTIANGASTSNAVSPGTIVSIDTGTFIAVGATGVMANNLFQIVGGTQVALKTGTASGAITIYCQVRVEDGSPRTKTKTQTSVVKTGASTITLDHPDVYEIISVVDSDGVDQRANYRLDTNTTDYAYETSSLAWIVPELAAPTGSLTITYDYLAHGGGDFFSVDSYTSLAAGDAFIDEIPTYISPATGEEFRLQDCLDFRATGSANNLLVSGTVIQTDLQRFVGRVDSVCINKNGEPLVITGAPSDRPQAPVIPTEYFELERLSVPAYTPDVLEIGHTRVAATRYRMEDISSLEERVARLEDFTTLTAAELALVQTDIVDAASGLSRFKTGYLVEDFVDPFDTSDIYADGYEATSNPTDGAFARNELTSISLFPSTETGVEWIGNGYSLPFTEVPFIEVGVSSRFVNLNPFATIAFAGKLTATPSSISWVEKLDSPKVALPNWGKIDLSMWINPPPATTTTSSSYSSVWWLISPAPAAVEYRAKLAMPATPPAPAAIGGIDFGPLPPSSQ